MKKILLALAAPSFVLIVLWRPWEETPAPAESAPRTATAPVTPAPEPEPPPLVPPPPEPPAAPVTPVEVPAAERQRVLDAIDNLEFSFRDFANALGGNPVGTNAEITAALLGDNLKQLRLEIPEGSSLNTQGELCDPWGSPWFFHQLSGTRMEIRSAGPDRQHYTEDDFVR